jgi:hypothetical protein
MSWVLIYIARNFLAPSPLISPGINDFLFEFAPNRRTARAEFSRKSLIRLKPDLSPVKAGTPSKAGPSHAGQRHLLPLRLAARHRACSSSLDAPAPNPHTALRPPQPSTDHPSLPLPTSFQAQHHAPVPSHTALLTTSRARPRTARTVPPRAARLRQRSVHQAALTAPCSRSPNPLLHPRQHDAQLLTRTAPPLAPPQPRPTSSPGHCSAH